MKEYLLILRDHEERWDKFSPDDFQRVIGEFMAWNERLTSGGNFVGAGKLTRDRGTTVRKRGGQTVVDGPYAEARESIAGYYQVRAESAAHAAKLAAGCPILGYGGSVEVREMAS